eukprot:TRINITY_DN4406_c0_g4_i1.p1 TRINITY_DN4406_c0_g4~~TRINITY_DN4406_c0_g4_i1.p1  ORF type:complete len:340 (-),score=50.46 TRINITY_DN4406_c0_g4_i1:65-1084(-)
MAVAELVALQTLVADSIARGSEHFTAGRHRECAEVYFDCAQRCLASAYLPNDCREVLKNALQRAAEQFRETGAAERPAWQLRSALDYALGVLGPPRSSMVAAPLVGVISSSTSVQQLGGREVGSWDNRYCAAGGHPMKGNLNTEGLCGSSYGNAAATYMLPPSQTDCSGGGGGYLSRDYACSAPMAHREVCNRTPLYFADVERSRFSAATVPPMRERCSDHCEFPGRAPFTGQGHSLSAHHATRREVDRRYDVPRNAGYSSWDNGLAGITGAAGGAAAALMLSGADSYQDSAAIGTGMLAGAALGGANRGGVAGTVGGGLLGGVIADQIATGDADCSVM